VLKALLQRFRDRRRRRRDAEAAEIAGLSASDRQAMHSAANRSAKPSRPEDVGSSGGFL
jgi:hypothetical protein